jgi:hypothetical protein
MPYTTSDKVLIRLTARALASPDDDIRERAEQAGLSVEWLQGQVIRNSRSIWDSGAEQINRYNELEIELAREEKFDKESLPRRPLMLIISLYLMRALAAAGLILLLMLAFLIWWGSQGWGNALNNALTFTEDISSVPGANVVILIAAFVALLLLAFYIEGRKEYSKNVSVHRLVMNRGSKAREARRDEATKAVEEAVLLQGIKTFLKEVINSYLDTPFNKTLPRLNFSGLAEVFDSANEVATTAKVRLDFMLSSMPGGSIGIAGPRGAGKSTLLRSACRETISDSDLPQKLTLLTSAPVEYQPRDFILHIFSSICERVLEITTGGRRKKASVKDALEKPDALETGKFSRLLMLLKISFYSGFILLILGLALPLFLMKSNPQPKQSTAVQSQASAGDQSTDGKRGGSEPGDDATGPTRNPVSRYVEAIGVKPAQLIAAGLILMIISYTVGLIRPRRIWSSSGGRRIEDYLAGNVFAIGEDVDVERRGRLNQMHDQAGQWLVDIKFQQSYTTGWSGAFKSPVGLEGGLNAATSLALQQMSLPEIVHGLSDFLALVSRDFKVVIGIDELDKIESEDAAQKFLNEIKAIFGLPGVFYLISVSENAMSNFERRGLPFRDVFDSSFDNIVYVDYLSLDAAKRVIDRRILALPDPFAHLCYCLSGGLARDLIRACRSLMELSQPAAPSGTPPAEPCSNLSHLCHSLVINDLRMKIHATVIAAGRLGGAGEVTALIDRLHAMELRQGEGASLLSDYIDLMKSTKPSQAAENNVAPPALHIFMALYDDLKKGLSPGKESSTGDKNNPQICTITEQFATYVYYCATLLEFFNEDLDEMKLQIAAGDKGFEKLARARQLISINHRVAKDLITRFRERNNLSVPAPN